MWSGICVHFIFIDINEILRSCSPMCFSNHLVDSRWLSTSEKKVLKNVRDGNHTDCGEVIACYLPNGNGSTALQGHVVRGETH